MPEIVLFASGMDPDNVVPTFQLVLDTDTNEVVLRYPDKRDVSLGLGAKVKNNA